MGTTQQRVLSTFSHCKKESYSYPLQTGLLSLPHRMLTCSWNKHFFYVLLQFLISSYPFFAAQKHFVYCKKIIEIYSKHVEIKLSHISLSFAEGLQLRGSDYYLISFVK